MLVLFIHLLPLQLLLLSEPTDYLTSTMIMKPPVRSEEEISQTLLSLLNAYEIADIPKLQDIISRDVDIHIHELDLYGRSAFFRIYEPERFVLSKYSVKADGHVGWSYGTIRRKNEVMHFSAVFREKRRHQWKVVHIHLSDASL